jgi:tetratricopeptide (TPR) repeat protein
MPRNCRVATILLLGRCFRAYSVVSWNYLHTSPLCHQGTEGIDVARENNSKPDAGSTPAWRRASRQAGFTILLVLCLHPSLAYSHLPPDEQIVLLSEQIRQQPEDASLYQQRGDLHRLRGDRAKARTDYLRARQLEPAMLSVDLRLGVLALEDGEPRQARVIFDRYLRRRPDDPEGLKWRARALREMGLPLKAADDFRRAIAAIPPPYRGRPEDYLDWSRALEAAGGQHLPEAIQALENGMKALGPIVSLQLPAIDLDLRMGRFDEALRRVEVLEAGPGRREVWLLRRGEILERAGRMVEAREVYLDALASLESPPQGEHRSRALGSLEASVRAALSRVTSPPADCAVEPR